ncbi:hypothetical protein B5807_06749 [Epicoccum nigrum]|uniref:Uncharacterized protein n=1 Tax=Epicoccum nigrum TaxID=105696 RepID=A0A1Y2LXL3_EPING|nr:hypothetical protein B5807_06749 [Epicoccum nigrum]
MKQKSLRGTGGSHKSDHKTSNADGNGSGSSDDDTDIESDGDNDSDNEEQRSEDHSKNWFASFVADVLLYTTCLNKLGNALESPAPEAEHDTYTDTRAIAPGSDRISTNTDLTTEGICVQDSSSIAEDSDSDAHSPGEKTSTLESRKDISATDPKSEEKRVQSPDVQLQSRTSLLDLSCTETFATLDANGSFTVLDLKDVDNSWPVRSRPSYQMKRLTRKYLMILSRYDKPIPP